MYVGGTNLKTLKNNKMARIKDVQLSMQEQEQNSFNQLEIARIAVQENPPTTETKYHIFKLVDTNKNGGTYIPNIDDVINPETGKEERIRLLSGVESIWVKDQKGLDLDYIRQNAKSLAFHRGQKVLRIPDWDKTSLEFARICRHNIGNPNRKSGSKFEFFEYDPSRQAKEALERESLEIDMAIIARELDEVTLKKYASFLKITMHDELGELKTIDSLRKELMLYAKRNAFEFRDIINNKSKEIEINYLVKKAILSAKIDVGSQPGRAFWSNAGGLIGVIPSQRQPLDYLVELALTNTEEGRTFQKQLNETMK
jgi:hypothetical protein